jgi:hypothetical protein
MKSIFTSVFIIALALTLSQKAKAQSTAEAIIIEQPHDVIECEGSLDQYLFVVAAPSQKQYKIAYRWLKDGRAITSWVEDFGQLTFDTLRYRMSGLYNAELFAFDPNWTSAYGNPFSYDSARVSPIVSSEKANLYVLQPPSFMKDIESQTIGLGQSATFTFDANIYGEHNMDDPTYWTDIQWFKDTIALFDNEKFSGTQSSILNIIDIEDSDYSAKYRVRLSGGCDTIWSNEFAINFAPLIDIYTYGQYKKEFCIDSGGATVYIYVRTKPLGNQIEYQWYLRDTPIQNDLSKYKITFEPEFYSNIDRIGFSVWGNPDFDDDRHQKYKCEIWPTGFRNQHIYIENFEAWWVDPLEIVKDLEDEYIIQEGEYLNFKVETNNPVLKYKWFKDSLELFLTDSIYPIRNAQISESGVYRVELTNVCGTISSNKAKLTVTPKQTITDIEDNSADQEISIYPNPLTSNSTLTISPSSSGRVSVMLIDLLGNKLANIFEDIIQQDQSESIKLNIDNIGLSSGTYYLIIQMGDRVETRQISVVR